MSAIAMPIRLVHFLEENTAQTLPQVTVSEAAALIRRSFATVATDFSLTPENCPRHPAFLSDETYAEQLCRPQVICLGVFSAEQKLIGFAAMWPAKRHTWELARLCTAPDHRHQGIGKVLLTAAKQLAHQRGAKRIHLDIIDENTVLKQWYASHGFRASRRQVIEGLPFTISEMTL